MTDTDETEAASTRTRRGVLAAAGTTIAVALAGCQGGSDPPGAADTKERPDSEPTGGTPAPLELPDGTSESGIDDPAALIEATQSALATTDYETASGLAQSDLTVDHARRSSLDDRRQLQVFDTEEERNEIFVADGTVHIRSERGGEITYSVTQTQQSFEDRHRRSQLGGSESLGGILEQGSYTPAETVRHNDRRVRSFALGSAQLPSDDVSVIDAEGGLLVDADSVVHEAILALEFEGEAGSETLDRRFTVSALGPLDVPEPEWVETARRRQG